MNFIKESISYLIIILVVIIIRTFIATPVKVIGTSMVPTLNGKEILLLKKYDTNYERFDIVVIDKSVEGDELIKRVIGLPGETLEYYNEQLYINGKLVEDNYGKGLTGDIKKITLGPDEYYVLGDNREVSVDSRIVGIIKKNEIEGTTEICLFPFNKIGNID